MMVEYKRAELEVTTFDAEDIITTSGEVTEEVSTVTTIGAEN